MRKTCFTCGNRGTFGIPIYGVLILYRPFLTESIVVQIKDIVLAFSMNLVGFPSLPVVEVKKVK